MEAFMTISMAVSLGVICGLMVFLIVEHMAGDL